MKKSSWQKRHSFTFAALILALIAGFTVAGCGQADKNEPGDAQLGALEVKHSVTVTGLICPLEPEKDVTQPASGMQFARLEVVIVNESGQELIISPADYQLETSDGATYNFDLEFVDDNILPTVATVGPGASISGFIVYQIPLDAGPSALIEEQGGRQTRIELPAASS